MHKLLLILLYTNSNRNPHWLSKFHQFGFCNPIFIENFHYNVTYFAKKNVPNFFPHLIMNKTTYLLTQKQTIVHSKSIKEMIDNYMLFIRLKSPKQMFQIINHVAHDHT